MTSFYFIHNFIKIIPRTFREWNSIFTSQNFLMKIPKNFEISEERFIAVIKIIKDVLLAYRQVVLMLYCLCFMTHMCFNTFLLEVYFAIFPFYHFLGRRNLVSKSFIKIPFYYKTSEKI